MHDRVWTLRLDFSHFSVVMPFVLLLFFTLTLAAPLDLSLDIATFKNLTATTRCSSSQDWQAYAFLVEDCYAAIQRVYIERMLNHPDEAYEFVAPGAPRRSKKPGIRTPAQYTVSELAPVSRFHPMCLQNKTVRLTVRIKDSCTLSIVMLNWFGRRDPLPGRGPGGHEQTDTATFREIYNAARIVERDCLLPTRLPGWDVVSKKTAPVSPLIRIPSWQDGVSCIF